MNKENDLNYYERGKMKEGSPEVPGLGKEKGCISPERAEDDLDKVFEEFTKFEIPEDLLKDFDKETLRYKLLHWELKFQCMKKIGMEGLQIVRRMIGHIDENMLRRLLKAMRTRQLTAEEVEVFEFFLNDIWFPDLPGQEKVIEEENNEK